MILFDKIFRVIVIIAFLQCTLSLELLGNLSVILSGASGTSGSINATGGLTSKGIGNIGGNILGASLGKISSVVYTIVNVVDTVGGGLVQVVDGITDDIINKNGIIIDGVLGLKDEFLRSLQIYKPSDIPEVYSPVATMNYHCVSKFIQEFQIFHPEVVRIVTNIYQIVEYFFNYQKYCTQFSSKEEVADCLRIGEATASSDFNRFSVDTAVINANVVAQWTDLFKNKILSCYEYSS